MANAKDKSTDDNRQPDMAALSIDKDRILSPELLAPAGEPEAVYGAFSAGADAVYLGAERFSARAYARNLSQDELIRALDHAHLFGKKIYLACNILLRRSEIDDLYPILDPLYEHGLDGIIVQDTGLLLCLGRRYPKLPLHASTQMSVNSVSGALWLKEHGVCRVVPGRELSLKEIKQIKECGIEVECFVHGAMCYSYSGKCLLSSLAGGRSGNRGRCAGPCRQPYSLNGGKSAYYLSMKDMMALGALPGLIKAGVDSFKIEGRMKAPEYSAGVSSVYRKYIDMYLSGAPYNIDKADLEMLEELYMRSGRQEGYLNKHNGRDMISIDSPAYSKVSEERKEKIKALYIDRPLKKPVEARIVIKAGEEALLTLDCDGRKVSVKGDKIDGAKKRPLSDEEIRKQILKTGDTDFEIKALETENDGASFMPVSALNALRRDAFEKLSGELRIKRSIDNSRTFDVGKECKNTTAPVLKIGVSEAADIRAAAGESFSGGFIVDITAFAKRAGDYIKDAGDKELYLRLPSVIRQKDIERLSAYIKEAAGYPLAGIYCGCIDGIKLIKDNAPGMRICGDQGLYVFNPYSEEMMLKDIETYTYSHEFSASEISGAIRKDAAELIVYGRIPVMYSANCVIKTDRACDKKAGWNVLSDEKGHSFPVRPVHEFCYNIIYNCVPTSLHREIGTIYKDSGIGALRLEFTDESPEEILKITRAFIGIMNGSEITFPLKEGSCSRGHYRRGVE